MEIKNKVVDYQIKTPSMREHDLTWRPYGYYKRRKAMAAFRRCIALKSIQILKLSQQWIRRED